MTVFLLKSNLKTLLVAQNTYVSLAIKFDRHGDGISWGYRVGETSVFTTKNIHVYVNMQNMEIEIRLHFCWNYSHDKARTEVIYE